MPGFRFAHHGRLGQRPKDPGIYQVPVSASFDLALPYTLRNEGGWANFASDPGGATNYGITLETARKYGIADAEALRNITPEQVAAIYRAGYWRFDGVDDQRVATKLFDMAVNMGPQAAVRICQSCLNDAGAALEVDGRFGLVTLECLNAVRPALILSLLCTKSADYYRAIVAKRPESVKFLRGWLKRAAEVPA